ncbi:MAG TPA: acyloxyacyl hydrolase [Opitutaceae bacterium]|nr:acyloxyacyl hydrolase [Opitutaceae bacterium]
MRRHLRIRWLSHPISRLPTLVRFLLPFLVLTLVSASTGRSEVAPAPSGGPTPKPWETHAFDVSSGVLWGLKRNTPLAYRMVPTEFTWRSPLAFHLRDFADGSRLLIRHRLTLIASWIDQGPESRYLAFSGSPSVEWWNAAGTWALVGGAGGGFGWLDARSVPGGQGQDFTLNWFSRIGVEHARTARHRMAAGVMFQHLSNGGQTDPNPGVDAVGVTVMHTWAF